MKKKDKILKIRYSEEEYNEIFEFVKNKTKFKNVSEYVRHLIKKSKNNYKEDECKGNMQELSYHLSRIGNNLNQLAYVLNKANLEDKIDDELIKEMTKELMYINVNLNEIG